MPRAGGGCCAAGGSRIGPALVPTGLGIRYADHVALRVADYDQSLRFYTGKPGFQWEAEWTLGEAVPGGRCAYLSLGSFKMELIGATDSHCRPRLPLSSASIWADAATYTCALGSRTWMPRSPRCASETRALRRAVRR
jgi:hypothetical protein